MESERQTKVENNEVGESIWRVTKSLSMNVSFFKRKFAKAASHVELPIKSHSILNKKSKKITMYTE